ncbi:MOSC domain-containing protein [Rhodobacter sp. Har01]|uniref:MOSC domain-containing protein n=1 Tax=Rhodobacter sp. Har01 TaxID=2883999 RepID=UPI001D07B44D|nr:MOSC domain-containing protein [Rhodobacter sp. Har01]MCB6178404.1 MOSC domain-containing protein [Rhodobacter sp. Har01]
MPALLRTALTGTVTWLGVQRRPVEALEIFGEPVAEMPLTFAGFADETHAGLTRPSCSRVLGQHPRGTTIRNSRQLCLVCAQEMAQVAATLGMERIDPAWLGASVVISGLPDFSHLPPSSRLQGPDGVTLVVDMENRPCQEPAITMARATGGQGKAFKTAAQGKRGVTAWVEREGTLRIGDSLTLHIPDQRPWAHLDTARAGKAG